METKRYSLRTAGILLGITATAITYRAQKLGIDTTGGLTAEDVKKISNFRCSTKYTRKCSVEDLKRELEDLK